MLRLHPLDPRFPRRLNDADPPAVLVADGPLATQLDCLAAVSIVGTRRPCSEALEFTRRLAWSLAEAGMVVVSGGARGIDTMAHRAALEARGKTVAVLPGAIDAWVPAENASLFRRIREDGALVAIVERPQRPRFHARNAVIACLSDHVVVTAAPIESGARNTANFARKAGRRLWVVPGSPWDESMAGCGLELSIGGAQPLLAPEQLLRHLRGDSIVPRVSELRPVGARARATTQELLPFLGADEHDVLARLAERPATIDQLVMLTQRSASAMTAALGGLTVRGQVREVEPGVFAVARRPTTTRP